MLGSLQGGRGRSYFKPSVIPSVINVHDIILHNVHDILHNVHDVILHNADTLPIECYLHGNSPMQARCVLGAGMNATSTSFLPVGGNLTTRPRTGRNTL